MRLQPGHCSVSGALRKAPPWKLPALFVQISENTAKALHTAIAIKLGFCFLLCLLSLLVQVHEKSVPIHGGRLNGCCSHPEVKVYAD